jgi:hypothetical protein
MRPVPAEVAALRKHAVEVGDLRHLRSLHWIQNTMMPPPWGPPVAASRRRL